MTSAVRPVSGTASIVSVPFMSSPTTSTPAAFNLASASGSEGTRQSVACSTAPADARNIAADSGADRCSGHTTAVAPSATLDLTIAPKFCGSAARRARRRAPPRSKPRRRSTRAEGRARTRWPPGVGLRERVDPAPRARRAPPSRRDPSRSGPPRRAARRRRRRAPRAPFRARYRARESLRVPAADR